MRFFATLASGLLALGALAAAGPSPDQYGGSHGCRHWNYNRQSVSWDDYNRHWKHQSNVRFVSHHGNTVIIIIQTCDDHHHKRSAEPEAAPKAAPEAAPKAAPDDNDRDHDRNHRCKHFVTTKRTVSLYDYNHYWKHQSNVRLFSRHGNVVVIIITICNDDHHHKRSAEPEAAPEAAPDNPNDHRGNDHHDNDRHDNDRHDNDHRDNDNNRNHGCRRWIRTNKTVFRSDYDNYWKHQSNVTVLSRRGNIIIIIITTCGDNH